MLELTSDEYKARLSKREWQIAQLISKGHRATEIGKMLFISVKTVSSHAARIKGKLGIKTSVEWMQFLKGVE